MALTNAEITAQAREMLKGNLKLPILASAVYLSIIVLLNCIPVIGWLAGIVISGPLILGYCMVYLSFVRTRDMRCRNSLTGSSASSMPSWRLCAAHGLHPAVDLAAHHTGHYRGLELCHDLLHPGGQS